MDIQYLEFNSKPILVSVIIPVYNQGKYLSECLDSILNQTMKNIEVIIVDDGSYDLSYDIALTYAKNDDRVKAYQIPNSGGPSKPRNIGMQLAKGDYIIFVDSDDKLALDALEILYSQSEKLQAEITICADMMFDQNGSLYSLYLDDLKYGSQDVALPIQYRLQQFFRGACWGILFNAKFIKKINILFNEDLIVGEDQIFMINVLSQAKNIAYNKNIFYFYRKNHTSTSLMTGLNKKSIDSLLLFFKENDKLFLNSNDKFKFAREILLVRKLLMLWHYECKLKDNFFYNFTLSNANIFLSDDDEIILKLQDEKFSHSLSSHFYANRINLCNLFKKYFYKIDSVKIKTSVLNNCIPISKPKFAKSNEIILPIVFAANQHYIPYFECSLASLIQKASPKFNYHIIVLERDWTEIEKKSIINRYTKINIAISFFTINSMIDHINAIEKAYLTIDIYFRLRISSILKDYEKCIYIASDIIINDDISKLFNIDLEDKYIGAVIDYAENNSKEYLNDIGLNTSTYFNSGILLWNLKKCSENNIEEEFIKISNARKTFINIDQDILNIVFYDKVKFLDYRWNYHSKDPKLEEKHALEQLEVWDKINNNFSILHYMTGEKPWLNRNGDKANYFWDIAKQTMNYEKILKRYAHYVANKPQVENV